MTHEDRRQLLSLDEFQAGACRHQVVTMIDAQRAQCETCGALVSMAEFADLIAEPCAAENHGGGMAA